jgi:hypothetical protein
MRKAVAVVIVGVAVALTTPSASAEVLGGPTATKLCAGIDGGGIRWSTGLTEGWRAFLER